MMIVLIEATAMIRYGDRVSANDWNRDWVFDCDWGCYLGIVSGVVTGMGVLIGSKWGCERDG